MSIKSLLSSVSLALLLSGAAVTAQAQIAIGQLADYSGGTSDVGTPYGQGVADAFAWVNKNGGIGGKPVSVDTVDYGYQVPKAVALYKKWSSPDSKVAAIMGWGTADTEALTGFVTQDKIPDISGSYAAALSDPTGASGKAKAAPYSTGRPTRMRCRKTGRPRANRASRNSCIWAPTIRSPTRPRPPAKRSRPSWDSKCCHRWCLR
jgi:branched-chain amino acid transport system substrate-binding protein